jgi:hypothetical protein
MLYNYKYNNFFLYLIEIFFINLILEIKNIKSII